MSDTENKVERFSVPTVEQILRIEGVDEEAAARVVEVLSRRTSRDYTHEDQIAECDDLLGTCGIETIDPENADTYRDDTIAECPPFSYCNTGDSYALTLVRDHEAGKWCIASWADMLEEYEQENELGDFEEFDACPDRCTDCHAPKAKLKLEPQPNSARGPSYSWICQDCNHHHMAVLDLEPADTCEYCGDIFISSDNNEGQGNKYCSAKCEEEDSAGDTDDDS